MPKNTHEAVASLKLDLKNFRTVPQVDEEHAINALIGIEPEWFWALMESLLDDGYSPTENIIVLKDRALIVKEGNRRVAALKLIHGIYKNIDIPEHLQHRIASQSSQWKKQNRTVPCAIYEKTEEQHVDRLVSRTHAKGEKAGRADWTAVARARYARDQSKRLEPGLDLLEKYLAHGKNLSTQQAERWAGDFPVTVLDEAIQKLVPHISLASAVNLVASYPAKNKKLIDAILYDIGISHLGFKELRSSSTFWGEFYGVYAQSTNGGQTVNSSTGGAGLPPNAKRSTSVAYASNDPKSVRQALRAIKVQGKGRDKVVTLLNEMRTLKHEDHPHAFCFLLRSVFELSAKAYCSDHKKTGGPDPRKKDGSDRALGDLVREITNHLTGGEANKAKVKLLHGAMTELGRRDGILSVSSLNQLVHNPSFSVAPPDISLLFWNVSPLLVEMNA